MVMHVSFRISVLHSPDELPEVELLCHKVVIFLLFWGTSILFSIVAAPICIPTNSAWRFSFIHILSNTCHCGFTEDSVLRGVRWCLIVVLICLSLMISVVEHLFTCLLAIFLSSLKRSCLGSQIIFSNRLIFLVLSCVSSLHILYINPLSDVLLSNIFSHSVGCLYHRCFMVMKG